MLTFWHYPKKLKTKEARERGEHKDKKVLPLFFGRGHPVVTSDRTIVDDNLECFQGNHPGVIIISNSEPTPEIDFRDIEGILEHFKTHVPSWHQLSWLNGVVEITDEWVEVRCVAGGKVTSYPRIDFATVGWEKIFLDYLHQIAAEGSQATLLPPDQAGSIQPPA